MQRADTRTRMHSHAGANWRRADHWRSSAIRAGKAAHNASSNTTSTRKASPSAEASSREGIRTGHAEERRERKNRHPDYTSETKDAMLLVHDNLHLTQNMDQSPIALLI
jgi:hypothetical protein